MKKTFEDEMEGNHRRIWVKGYYRRMTIEVYEKGKLVEKEVRRWISGYWKYIKFKK